MKNPPASSVTTNHKTAWGTVNVGSLKRPSHELSGCTHRLISVPTFAELEQKRTLPLSYLTDDRGFDPGDMLRYPRAVCVAIT
jgi:hypothetical protein